MLSPLPNEREKEWEQEEFQGTVPESPVPSEPFSRPIQLQRSITLRPKDMIQAIRRASLSKKDMVPSPQPPESFVEKVDNTHELALALMDSGFLVSHPPKDRDKQRPINQERNTKSHDKDSPSQLYIEEIGRNETSIDALRQMYAESDAYTPSMSSTRACYAPSEMGEVERERDAENENQGTMMVSRVLSSNSMLETSMVLVGSEGPEIERVIERVRQNADHTPSPPPSPTTTMPLPLPPELMQKMSLSSDPSPISSNEVQETQLIQSEALRQLQSASVVEGRPVKAAIDTSTGEIVDLLVLPTPVPINAGNSNPPIPVSPPEDSWVSVSLQRPSAVLPATTAAAAALTVPNANVGAPQQGAAGRVSDIAVLGYEPNMLPAVSPLSTSISQSRLRRAESSTNTLLLLASDANVDILRARYNAFLRERVFSYYYLSQYRRAYVSTGNMPLVETYYDGDKASLAAAFVACLSKKRLLKYGLTRCLPWLLTNVLYALDPEDVATIAEIHITHCCGSLGRMTLGREERDLDITSRSLFPLTLPFPTSTGTVLMKIMNRSTSQDIRDEVLSIDVSNLVGELERETIDSDASCWALFCRYGRGVVRFLGSERVHVWLSNLSTLTMTSVAGMLAYGLWQRRQRVLMSMS
jgi:hypothetical protein